MIQDKRTWAPSVACVVTAVVVGGCAADVDDVSGTAAGSEQPLYGGTPVNPVEWEAVGQLAGGCGATLISDRGVLTAAHCVCTGGLSTCLATTTVNFRSVLRSDGTRGDVPMAGAVHVHPWYGEQDGGPNDYDFAVIMLNEPARARTREVEPIWVQSWHPSVGTWARVIGWGSDNDDCTTGSGVKRTALYRIDEVDSHSIYFYQGSGNVHYCGGDSGGPVIDPTSGRVVGVNSYVWFDWWDFPPHSEDVAAATPGAFPWIASKACWYDPNHADLWNQCTNPLCPCDRGQGDCDWKSECKGNLVCNQDVGAGYGLPWDVDVCECPGFNPSAPDGNFCSTTCPCGQGQGHCEGDWECAGGLVCGPNSGPQFGLPPGFGVCASPEDVSTEPQCPTGWSCCESWGTTCTLCIPAGGSCP